MPDPIQVAVIGGGISGLSCAYRLQQLGLQTVLLESSANPGGLMASVQQNGFLFESGPQSFQGTPTLMQMIRELGLESQLCTADPRAPRYVLRHGRMEKIAMSPQALLVSSLLSVKSRWKIASEPFRSTKPPSEEESIAAFVRRKFGHEILEYLVSPFVSGVYAGDPEKLSLRAAFPSLEEWEREHGSVLRGAAKAAKARKAQAGASSGPPSLCSFRHGMATLPKAIAESLGGQMRIETSAVSITMSEAAGSQRYQIELQDASGANRGAISASAIVVAAPAYVASQVLRQVSSRVADTLSGIAYASVVVTAAGYYNKQAITTPDGFGVLIPRSEKRHTLGIVWNSSLFPGRSPDGQFAITSFLGGATDQEVVGHSDHEISVIAEKEAADILGMTGAPITSGLWRHPKALPQYNLGHAHIVESLREAERALPGLFFAGNYLEGPAIGKCVERGFKTAETVRDHFAAAVGRTPAA